MACPPILTGREFLSRTLAHIDCQAQVIGSYGYQSLGEPGSTASLLMSALLTIFVAIFAIRLMFQPAPGAQDIVFLVLKVGIVLTLAFSWPAFRTLVYDLVLLGPGEVSAAISGSSVPGTGTAFAAQLQAIDNAIVDYTISGTGRTTGALVDTQGRALTFESAALEDESTFGYARLAFLVGTLGPLIGLRIIAGLLLAIAPLAAGMLLFDATRGLFSGWLRGLVLSFVGSIGVTTVLAVQLAVMEPWLADALRLRQLGYATPAAPIELFAMTLAFALASIGVLLVLARVAFTRGWITMPTTTDHGIHPVASSDGRATSSLPDTGYTRVRRMADHMERTVRREEQSLSRRSTLRDTSHSYARREVRASDAGRVSSSAPVPVSFSRRSTNRRSRAGSARDAIR